MKLPYLNKLKASPQLVEIIGVPEFAIVQVIQQQDKVRDGHYTIGNKDLAKNRNCESNDPDIKSPQASGSRS
jgi:hypothetical protein